jgi:hypothetical protein
VVSLRFDILYSQICGDFTELFKGGFEIFNDCLGKNIGIGKIGRFFQAFVSEQKMSRLEFS